MSSNCKAHGHSFRPRFDLRAPKWLEKENRLDWLADSGVQLEHVYEKIYVHDVCTKCGMIVSRSEKATKAA